MYRTGFCSSCSVTYADRRVLRFLDGTVECLTCGKLQLETPLMEDDRYVYLKAITPGTTIDQFGNIVDDGTEEEEEDG